MALVMLVMPKNIKASAKWVHCLQLHCSWFTCSFPERFFFPKTSSLTGPTKKNMGGRSNAVGSRRACGRLRMTQVFASEVRRSVFIINVTVYLDCLACRSSVADRDVVALRFTLNVLWRVLCVCQKAALAKRLLDYPPNSKAKMKKVENKSAEKVQTVSAKDSASENESKSVTPNKSEPPVKNSKSTDSKTPTGHKTSHLRVWAKTCPPASTPRELKCITSERRTLSSKRIILERQAVAGTALSARRKHMLKIVSSVKKRTDADNQNKVCLVQQYCSALSLISQTIFSHLPG